MITARGVLVGLIIAALAATPAASGGRDVLFWAPFAPGSPEQAEGAMEEFALYLEAAAGWERGSATARYRNSVEDGLETVEESQPGFAMVSLPVYLRFHECLDWQPLLAVETADAPAQRYSLFGPSGSTLESLTGSAMAGDSVYDPAFVQGLVLGPEGPSWTGDLLPTSRPLSAVRRVAGGDRLAVLLDEGQRRALDVLPSAEGLSLLAESGWMPAAVVIRSPVADEDDAQALIRALRRAASDTSAAGLLETLRIRRFTRLDSGLLESLQLAYLSGMQRLEIQPDPCRRSPNPEPEPRSGSEVSRAHPSLLSVNGRCALRSWRRRCSWMPGTPACRPASTARSSIGPPRIVELGVRFGF